MDTIRERAEYLVRLMPTLSRGIAERIPAYKHSVSSQLTISQLHILGFLYRHGRETMGAMAKCSRVAMSTMTESVDRLVKTGLVTRILDAKDRRVVRIQLTAKGQIALKHQYAKNQELFVRLLESLSGADQKKLVSAFRTIEKILLGKKTAEA